MTRREVRKALRLAAGLQPRDTRPVKIRPGSLDAPQEVGARWGYETRGGRPIRYPSAYRKAGWSNMVYCRSTRCVEVGSEWLRKHQPAWYAALVGARLLGGDS
jgi:hypothetical protein